MSTSAPIFAVDIIAANLDTGEPQGDYARTIARQVMAALEAAGVVVINPQDMAWGKCPGNNEGGPHEVSTSLCVYCLEYDPE